jgi:G3E family GTPase
VSVPVLVVTGFLGSGKTTFINTMLTAADGRRIAAIVNDFGAINIDAELIADRADSVIGLRNGCVCCSLQGDLLRTLKIVLTQQAKPDQIVIEASGVADPRGIVEVLADPVLWNSVRHDAVICIVDADDILNNPARRTDDLWRAQADAADFLALSKTADLPKDKVAELTLALAPDGRPPVFDLAQGGIDPEILFAGPHARRRTTLSALRIGTDRFASVEWQVACPVPQAAFQRILEDLAPGLVRAKGIVSFAERPGRSYLLQMVGTRATLAPVQDASSGCRLVLIGEADRFDANHARLRLAELQRASSTGSP